MSRFSMTVLKYYQVPGMHLESKSEYNMGFSVLY